jgi:hypothetical protein
MSSASPAQVLSWALPFPELPSASHSYYLL